MATERERKFLVVSDGWKAGAVGTRYRQGYLSFQPAVRVRIAGDQGYLTIKGPLQGMSRPEFEYPIPLEDALLLLETLCHKPLIEKTRYRVPYGGHTWEVDVFEGENRGLVVAELELPSEQPPARWPDWVGEEVSDDPRYANASLVQHPYSEWGR